MRCGARGAHGWDGQCHDLEDVILRAGRPEHAVEIEAAWPLGLIRREDLEQPESGVSANAMRLMCASQFGATGSCRRSGAHIDGSGLVAAFSDDVDAGLRQ